MKKMLIALAIVSIAAFAGFFPRLIERGYLPLSAQSIFLLNP